MASDSKNLRERHFADNWLAWAALRHFLSARLVRELAYVIVDQMSNGTLSVDQLFDEAIAGPEWFDSWLLQPLEVRTPLGEYLQHRIQSIAWPSDAEMGVSPEVSVLAGVIQPSALEKSIRLGAVDFDCPERLLNELRVTDQRSISVLSDAIATGRKIFRSSTCQEFLDTILHRLVSIEGPLAVITVKHLGDLCADGDAWDMAFALYEEADSRISKGIDSVWDGLESSLRAIITQSRASAIRTLKGTDAAADLLSKALAATTISDAPLLLTNASHDALVARYASFDRRVRPERRAALLLPPLIWATHNPSSALQAWLEGDFHDSQRRFWAVLRRQIALGLATESRITKALYARSVLDGLVEDIARQHQPELFHMAIRLLLESGNSTSVAKIRWTEQLINTYVDERCVDFVIAHAKEHAGSSVERQRVVIELFQHWAELTSLDQINVAESMLKYVAALALELPTSLFAPENIGGRSLEVLHYVAQKRPELRNGVASEVAEAVIAKLSVPTFWTARQAALETAQDYGDVFSQGNFTAIIRATLDGLAKTDPAAEAWPIVRPALAFLVSGPVKRLSKSVPELGQRIVDAVLRFGVQQKTEHARVLFYLHDFDSTLLRDASVADKLRGPVIEMRHRALQSNASDAVENIQALLLAPVISGSDGVHNALDGLTRILKSVSGPRISIALPSAYQPLLLLATRQQKIADALSLSLDSFRSWLTPILKLVISLWSQAKDQPLLFAPFSLPPATIPSSIIVHNWAYASILFAESLQQGSQLLTALDAARTQSVLADPIALARATRSVAGSEPTVNPAEIRTENRDTFYSILGRRLVVLQSVDNEQGRQICKALLDQCFRQGPRDLDAAVLLSASRLNLSTYVTQTDRSDYVKRVENARDLRMTLVPILEMLGVSPQPR